MRTTLSDEDISMEQEFWIKESWECLRISLVHAELYARGENYVDYIFDVKRRMSEGMKISAVSPLELLVRLCGIIRNPTNLGQFPYSLTAVLLPVFAFPALIFVKNFPCLLFYNTAVSKH